MHFRHRDVVQHWHMPSHITALKGKVTIVPSDRLKAGQHVGAQSVFRPVYTVNSLFLAVQLLFSAPQGRGSWVQIQTVEEVWQFNPQTPVQFPHRPLTNLSSSDFCLKHCRKVKGYLLMLVNNFHYISASLFPSCHLGWQTSLIFNWSVWVQIPMELSLFRFHGKTKNIPTTINCIYRLRSDCCSQWHPTIPDNMKYTKLASCVTFISTSHTLRPLPPFFKIGLKN